MLGATITRVHQRATRHIGRSNRSCPEKKCAQSNDAALCPNSDTVETAVIPRYCGYGAGYAAAYFVFFELSVLIF